MRGNKNWRDAWVDSIENHEDDTCYKCDDCDECDAVDDDDCAIKREHNECPSLPDEAA